MTSNTDWGRGGQPGFQRDTNNEQVTPLAAGAAFVGEWTRVDKVKMFAVLYGTHVPFTLQIQWSKDGVTQDTDPFSITTPQVRFRLGLYSVISFQSTFFRPYYRIKVINGPSPQLFAISDLLLMDTIFPGYLIDVDGPIPVLGLAALNHGLAWGRTPTGWQPQQLTAALNQRTAIMENLAGLATDAKLDAVIAKLDAVMTALEQTTVVLDAASLASLESITVQNNVTTDMTDRVARLLGVISGTVALDAATLAALETINAIVSGTVAVSNFPAATPTVIAAGTPTHLLLAGTTLVKTGAGVLERVIVNRISASGVVLLTLYNAVTADPTKILAVVQLGATAPGSSGVIAPASLDYFAAFTTGLTAVLSAVGADVTLVHR